MQTTPNGFRDNLRRRGSIGLRMMLVAALITATGTPIPGQSSSKDSLAIYLARAQALDSNSLRTQRASALPLWQRAVELSHAAGDTLNEAEALLGVASAQRAVNLLAQQYMPLIVSPLRRAAELFLAKGATLRAAEAYQSLDGVTDTFTADSVRAAQMVALSLFRQAGDRISEGRLLSRIRFPGPGGLDSTLVYAHLGMSVSRSLSDTLGVLLALNRIGIAYQAARDPTGPMSIRRAWRDSAAAYYREGVRLAKLARNSREEFADISNLVNLYSPTFPPDSVLVVTDSAFHYAIAYRDAARRVGDRAAEGFALSRISGLHWNFGNVDSARIYATQAIRVARAQQDSSTLYAVLSTLAANENRLGWPDSALVHLREQEALAQSVTMRSRLPLLWQTMANTHGLRGNSDSALFYYRRVLGAPPASMPVASRLNATLSLADAFLGSGRLDSAAFYYNQLTAAATTTATRVYAQRAQEGHGRILLARGALDSATVHFERMVRTSSGEDLGSALTWLAEADIRAGRIDSSMARRRRGLEMFRASRNTLGEATQLRALGIAFRQLGVMDSARAYLIASQHVAERAHDREQLRLALQWSGSVFLDADQLDSALTFNREALRIASMMNSPGPRATLNNNIGFTFLNIGQSDSARVYLERAARLHREAGSRDGEAAALTNLGFLRLKAAVDDSAINLLRRAIELRGAGSDRAGEAVPRLHLARAFAMTGRADSALAYSRSALLIARGARDRTAEGRALVEIGRAQASAGQTDSAQLYFTQAVDVMRRAGFLRGVRTTLVEIAELFRSRPGTVDLSRAIAYYDSAAAVVDNVRRGLGTDDNSVAIAEDQVDLFGGWARAWIGRAGEVGAGKSAAAALGAVERGRAQSLVDMLTKLQSDARRSALAASRPVIGTDLASEVDSSLAVLRSSRTAALTYSHMGDTLFTWLLLPTGELELQKPVAITETELTRMVRGIRKSLGADDARSAALDPDELAPTPDSLTARVRPEDEWKRLADLLLPADLATKVPSGTPIVIVPHGSIALVPFSALVEPEGGARPASRTDTTARGRVARDTTRVPLGVRHPIRYAPSFAALRASERQPMVVATRTKTNGSAPVWNATRETAKAATSSPNQAPTVVLSQALVVGNPTMPYIYSGRWSNRAKLRPLPGAEAESRAIARMLGAPALTGKAATESAVRSRMNSAPIIHFATHGLAYGTSSAARRSYVAFAPDSTQDGLLTLGELMDDHALRLHAELVVLSACQTGLGDLKKAEGSIGLQRAFLAKGARSVLVSLWNVDDAATRMLMERFYDYWLDPVTPRSKAVALQMAQDAVRRTAQYKDPKYWAAFQLVGAQ